MRDWEIKHIYILVHANWEALPKLGRLIYTRQVEPNGML